MMMRLLKSCIFTITFILSLFISHDFVYAVNTIPTADQKAAAEERKFLPVESNSWQGWPEGPVLGAESAILWTLTPVLFFIPKIFMKSCIPHQLPK